MMTFYTHPVVNPLRQPILVLVRFRRTRTYPLLDSTHFTHSHQAAAAYRAGYDGAYDL